MKSVNYFGKEYVYDGKWTFAASKLSNFSILTNFLTLIDILLDFILTNSLGEKGSVVPLDLAVIII